MSKWEDFEDELDIIEQRFTEHQGCGANVIAEYKVLRGVAINEVVARLFRLFEAQAYGYWAHMCRLSTI